jgi:DNA-binding transcriptional ArsR family regulator
VLFCYGRAVAEWSFLTNHARVLLCIARDPGVRLREIAATLGITERTAFGVVADLTDEGYVLKEREGRRNRYEIQYHLPLAEPTGQERTIGEVIELLGGHEIASRGRRRRAATARGATTK